MFDRLATHYEEMASNEHIYSNIPISSGEIKRVTNAVRTGKADEPVGLYMTAPATVLQLDDLLDELAAHYEGNDAVTTIDDATKEDLRDIFDTLADFYSFGEGGKFDDADELWTIYDSLAVIYDQKSDYDLDDNEVEDLYKKMASGQEFEQEFGDTIIKNFQDLMRLETT